MTAALDTLCFVIVALIGYLLYLTGGGTFIQGYLIGAFVTFLFLGRRE